MFLIYPFSAVNDIPGLCINPFVEYYIKAALGKTTIEIDK
jgi:hypothetical protein